jgi:hypothetical protein
MPKKVNSKFLLIAIALVQLFDIFIHAATNQLEFLRVTSNLVILVWLVVVFIGKTDTKFLPAAIGFVGLYLVLNTIFLAREGLTNPAQGGAPRTMLFALVALTAVLSTVLAYRHSAKQDE